MKVKNNVLKVTITDMLEEVKETMCDQYCKYPNQCGIEEWELDKLYEEHCNACPMGVL